MRYATIMILPALGALSVERAILAIYSVTANDARDFTDVPYDLNQSFSFSEKRRGLQFSTRMSLHELDREPLAHSCSSEAFVFRRNVPNTGSYDESSRIPKIIHQTSRSRCMTPTFYNATKSWELEGWSYHFHDDDAVDRLLATDFPEFPHLRMIVDNCLTSGTLKADLWRYVVLWVYGGLYADIDSIPNSFTARTIDPGDDGFFVVEQYHILSQYFMAVSPRHPLMYYAIHHSLVNLLQAADTGKQNAALVTGPHALHQAYISFRGDVGVRVDPRRTGYKPVWKGKFLGTQNRSVTVVGIGENENEYIKRNAVSAEVKIQDYKAMGMTHFHKYKKANMRSGRTCLSAIYHHRRNLFN